MRDGILDFLILKLSLMFGFQYAMKVKSGGTRQKNPSLNLEAFMLTSAEQFKAFSPSIITNTGLKTAYQDCLTTLAAQAILSTYLYCR